MLSPLASHQAQEPHSPFGPRPPQSEPEGCGLGAAPHHAGAVRPEAWESRGGLHRVCGGRGRMEGRGQTGAFREESPAPEPDPCHTPAALSRA